VVKNCEQDSSFSKGKFLKLIKGLCLEKLFRIVFIRLAPAQKEVKSKLAQIIFLQPVPIRKNLIFCSSGGPLVPGKRWHVFQEQQKVLFVEKRFSLLADKGSVKLSTFKMPKYNTTAFITTFLCRTFLYAVTIGQKSIDQMTLGQSVKDVPTHASEALKHLKIEMRKVRKLNMLGCSRKNIRMS